MSVAEVRASAGIQPLDCECILAHILRKDRSWLLAHPEATLTDSESAEAAQAIHRRRAGEPLAYILGWKEFCSHHFIVTPHVLIPRPATELLVEHTLEFLKAPRVEIREIDTGIASVSILLKEMSDHPLVVDVGTGSGCIAVSLALANVDLRIIATDIDQAALTCAQTNIDHYQLGDRITLLQGSLLEPLSSLTEPYIIVSNPPYVAEGGAADDVTIFEPHQAVFGGVKGNEIVSDLVKVARQDPRCCGLVLECTMEQARHLLS